MKKKNTNVIMAIVLIIVGLSLLIGGKVLLDSRKTEERLYACVYSLTMVGRKLVKTLPLQEGNKQRYNFEGPLGVTVVEVDGLRVRVLSSPCPDQVCVQFGWLSQVNDFSACLPNAMMVLIEDGKTTGN